MSSMGWPEILIIVGVIALFILIPKKLPQLARTPGRSIRGFKKGLKQGKKELPADEASQASEPEERT